MSQFVPDAHSPVVRPFLARGGLVLALSDFGIAEFISSVSRHLRIGRYQVEQASEIIDLFETWTNRHTYVVATEGRDVARATLLIKRFELGLRAPDALQVAICERIGATLLTFDVNQANAAKSLGIPLAL